jgi:hypothetical protein
MAPARKEGKKGAGKNDLFSVHAPSKLAIGNRGWACWVYILYIIREYYREPLSYEL